MNEEQLIIVTVYIFLVILFMNLVDQFILIGAIDFYQVSISFLIVFVIPAILIWYVVLIIKLIKMFKNRNEDLPRGVAR